MLFKQLARFIHIGRPLYATDKSTLSALRKKTGYSFSNCKKALELHNNDIQKAEQWLQVQAQNLGWTKAAKLDGRATSQGLIGVLIKNNIGAMLEVNCETDFVARNKTFQQFVQTSLVTCLDFLEKSKLDGDGINKIEFDSNGLKSIVANDGRILADHLALMIGSVGENASLRRAIGFKAPLSTSLCGYTHPAPTTPHASNDVAIFGKYGAIVAFKSNSETSSDNQRNVCQHIVGMKPSIIGERGKNEPKECKDDEDCLIFQEYLLDPSITVGEILEEFQLEVIDFHRYECGESDENVKLSKKSVENA